MDDCWFLARATGWVGLFLEIGEWGYEGNSLGRGLGQKLHFGHVESEIYTRLQSGGVRLAVGYPN